MAQRAVVRSSLKDVPYKAAYVSGVDNLVRDFYIPTLSKAVLYQRRTGYFNSRALAMAARGLSGLLRNGGRMQLLCSVQLDQTEAAVLKDPVAYLEKRAFDLTALLQENTDELDKQRLGLLAHLLATGLLEIHIGLRRGGIYHEKAGIFKDAEGNIVAFNGSGNETPGGWVNNTESFHVFTSWEDDRHIRPEMETFERLWEGRDPKTTVIPLPFAVVKGLIEFQDYYKAGVDDPFDIADQGASRSAAWEWTPGLAYVFQAPRLWNHHDFAYGETAIKPHQHQDYIASSVLSRWPPRVMLCDEVGLGKTIEAGLIVKGFQAAGRVDRCLILAPKNILKQWQEQLYALFNLEAWRLDGNYVVGPQLDPKKDPPREKVDATNPFRSKPLMLVGSQLVRSDERKEQLLGLEYDLVIVDEAHHARAGGPPGKRENNRLLDVLDELRFNTQGLILMTATPIQLDRRELWDLLNILELPGKWQDPESFDRFFDSINSPDPDWPFLLGMTQSAIEAWGLDEAGAQEIAEDFPGIDPYKLLNAIKERRAAVIQSFTSDELKAFKLLVFRHTPVRQMVFRHTRELLKRYRAEGKFDGKIADRKTLKDPVRLEGDSSDPMSERGLYDRIDRYVREYYAKYDSIRTGMGFIMETYRKRLTSSLHAIRLSLSRRRDRIREALETGDLSILFQGLDESEDVDDAGEVLEAIQDEVKGGLATPKMEALRITLERELAFLDDFLRDLTNLPADAKAEYLARLLREKIQAGTRQIIIFSQFGDTVDFLLEHFRPIYGDRLGSYTGEGGRYWDGSQWQTCAKQEVVAKFTDPTHPLGILVCTDAASEGLNLQTCNTLVNYDIPWNPMRIEQRIGRIDRVGQESPFVHVHTLFYEDTVEERVYDRCLQRIGFFMSALGHLQPILQATEKALRQAALAPDKASEEAVIANLDRTLAESVAKTDENQRIERLLNHYSPRLPLLQKRAPILQADLEAELKPLLVAAGWTQSGKVWTRGDQSITFDPKLANQTGRMTQFVTPQSPLAAFVAAPAELPESIATATAKFHLTAVQGLAAVIAEHQGRFAVVERYAEIDAPHRAQGSAQTLEDATEEVRHRIMEARRQAVASELQAWKNRERNWNVRATLYLDRIANWRLKTTAKPGQEVLPEAFMPSWREYLASPERESTRRLADTLAYRPGPDVFRKTRGRAGKTSPRSSEKEERMMEDLGRIRKRLGVLQGQLSG